MRQHVRPLKFRRKQDRIVLGIAILVILTGFWAYTQGCTTEKGPTVPDPVVTQPDPPAPTAVTPTVVAPAPNPTATPDTRRIFADCNKATGICTFRSGESRAFNVSGKCTEPAQDAPVHGTWNGTVVDGDTVDARDVCNKIEPYDCKPRQVPVQVDFHATGRHIGHLGPLWTMKLEQKLPPEECEECKEEPVTKYGEWSECLEVQALEASSGSFNSMPGLTGNTVTRCQRTQTYVTTLCGEIIDEGLKTEPCDCPCIEDPVVTSKCGEWNECHEHPVNSSLNRLSTTPGLNLQHSSENGCYQEKECVEHTDYQCKPDVDRPYEETRSCECLCKYEKPEYSNEDFGETNGTSWPYSQQSVSGSVDVTGPGAWRVEIRAASRASEYQNNDPDYIKVKKTKTLDCDSTHNFDLFYNTRSHSSDNWWMVIYLNNTLVWKSQNEQG